MPNNAAVQAISHRLPEACRPWVILLHQRRDPLRPLAGEPFFDVAHQRTGDSQPPMVGVNRHAVDIAPPPVEGADDGAHDLALGLGQQDGGLAFGDGSPEVIGVVRDAWPGVGLLPQVENCRYVLGAAFPEGENRSSPSPSIQKARRSLNRRTWRLQHLLTFLVEGRTAGTRGIVPTGRFRQPLGGTPFLP